MRTLHHFSLDVLTFFLLSKLPAVDFFLKYSVFPQRVISLSSDSRIKSLLNRDDFGQAYFLKLEDTYPR